MNNCPSNLWKLTSLSSLLTEGMMYISIYITVLYIYIYEIYSKCMIIFNESFQFQFMYHFKMYNW